MISLVLLWMMVSSAQEPMPDEAIVVEAHRDIEVYVSPIEVIISTDLENIEAEIDSNAAFAYSSAYRHNAKIKNERGTFEPVGLNHDKIMVYSEDTIIYAWDDCNYKIKPLGCSIQNSHYYLETTIHVDDNELVVRAMLYDQDAQIIAQGTSIDRKIVRWIKQQEVTQQQSSQNQSLQGSQRNCGTTSCSPPTNVSVTVPNTVVTTSKPKEEMPLKWVIPHRLLNKHVQQAMLKLWVSTKMDWY